MMFKVNYWVVIIDWQCLVGFICCIWEYEGFYEICVVLKLMVFFYLCFGELWLVEWIEFDLVKVIWMILELCIKMC